MSHKGAFKYYVILLGGGGESLKRSQKITGGEGGFTKRSQRITITRSGGGGALKRFAKLEVPIKIIITLRIRYQWVIQEVISS